MVDYRQPFVEVDVPYDTTPLPRIANVTFQQVSDSTPNFLGYYADLQQAADSIPDFRVYYLELQSIVAFEPSPWYDADTEGSDMSTEIFPELKGLTWDIKRRPMFSNKVQDHLSGKETRLAFWDQPKWEYELTYEYLPNIPKQVGDTDLETILGFFLKRKGNFQTFLYRFKGDNQATDQVLGTGNGTNADFTFIRSIGGFSGPVDYVDYVTTPPTFHWSIPTVVRVAASGTISTFPHITSIGAVTASVNPAVLTRVTGAPGPNEYSVNMTTGVFTFNASRNGQTITIANFERDVLTGYDLNVPNSVTFLTAPPTNTIVTSTFNYFHNVRFLESEAEFNEFYENLYELESITLRSVPV